MKQRLIDQKDSMTQREQTLLRNQASALQTRVNAKLEMRSMQNRVDFANSRCDILFKILLEELKDEDAYKRVASKLDKQSQKDLTQKT